MITIWKYEFDIADKVTILMPIDAHVLALGSQEPGCIHAWAKVDSDDQLEERVFFVKGTGEKLGDLPADVKFLGTVFEGPYVWHVFGVN